MAPIILLRLPAAARVIRARDGRQVIGALLLLQVVRVSGKEVVRFSGTRKNHPFADGSKRVAFTMAGAFLELNGFRLDASEHDVAQATRALSSRETDEAEFATWLRTCSSKLHVACRRGNATIEHRTTPKKK